MKNAKVLSALGLMSLASTAAMAASGPSLGSVLDASGLKVSGAVAASFRQDAHVADNTFQVDQALLSVAFQPKEGFGAVVDLASGDSAGQIGAGVGSNTSQNGTVGGATTGVVLSQAYLQYSSGKLTLSAGRYYTAAGYEVFPVTGNLFVTRSLAYNGYPTLNIAGESTYHNGVRANYAYSDSVSLLLGVNNGITPSDQNYDLFKDKSVEFGVNWKATSNVSLNLVGQQGKTAADARSSLYSAVLNWDLTNKFNLALSWDEANPDHNNAAQEYSAAALYASYAYSDKTKLGLRVEEINGTNNAPGVGSITGVVSYAIAKNFDLKTEVSSFDDETVGADRQIGAAVQGVLKF